MRIYRFRFFVEEIYIWIIIFITQNVLRIKGIKNIFSKFSFSTSKFIFLYEENSSQKNRTQNLGSPETSEQI